MIKVSELLKQSYPDARLVLQIHDELLIEAPDRGKVQNDLLINAVVGAMESVLDLSVPLKVDAGSGLNWEEAQL